ncbi:unnamed protein product, partial [Iphiclides podalirius]
MSTSANLRIVQPKSASQDSKENGETGFGGWHTAVVTPQGTNGRRGYSERGASVQGPDNAIDRVTPRPRRLGQYTHPYPTLLVTCLQRRSLQIVGFSNTSPTVPPHPRGPSTPTEQYLTMAPHNGHKAAAVFQLCRTKEAPPTNKGGIVSSRYAGGDWSP